LTYYQTKSTKHDIGSAKRKYNMFYVYKTETTPTSMTYDYNVDIFLIFKSFMFGKAVSEKNFRGEVQFFFSLLSSLQQKLHF